jgi:hypothetical protein
MKNMGTYKLIHIRTIDGAQEYHNVVSGSEFPTIWLAGMDRAKNVKVGDVGEMCYESTTSRGYYVFTPK